MFTPTPSPSDSSASGPTTPMLSAIETTPKTDTPHRLCLGDDFTNRNMLNACKWYLSKHWEWECLFCGHTPYAPSDPMDMVYKATLGQIEVASCEGRL